MKINCIALDDEPLAVELLCGLIKRIKFLNLTAAFSSASEALKYLSSEEVACLFIDIEMPDLNGIELTKIINRFSKKPEIIFVTAYSHYTIEQLNLHATDFLLKPYSFSELKAAAQKALKNIETAEAASKEKNAEAPTIFVKVDARQVKIYTADIVYIESMRDYIKIFTETRSLPYMPLMPLKKIKEFLPQEGFLQINRSQIIPLQKIQSFGKTSVTLSGKKFSVSEGYKQTFLAAVQQLSTK